MNSCEKARFSFQSFFRAAGYIPIVKVKGDIDIGIGIDIVIDTDKQFINNIEIISNLKTSLTD